MQNRLRKAVNHTLNIHAAMVSCVTFPTVKRNDYPERYECIAVVLSLITRIKNIMNSDFVEVGV